jgi:hypothetical protein
MEARQQGWGLLRRLVVLVASSEVEVAARSAPTPRASTIMASSIVTLVAGSEVEVATRSILALLPSLIGGIYTTSVEASSASPPVALGFFILAEYKSMTSESQVSFI